MQHIEDNGIEEPVPGDIIQIACVSFFAGCVIGAIFGHSVAHKSKLAIEASGHSAIVFTSTASNDLARQALETMIIPNVCTKD